VGADRRLGGARGVPVLSGYAAAYSRFRATEDTVQAHREWLGPSAGPGVGPLAGVVVGVKELYVRSRAGWVSPLPARLEAAGAEVVAVHRAHELGLGLDDPGTRHPLTGQHYPGGSTAGGGVAVAVGACDLALGTDGGGSVRKPAALCGVVGLKPTHGLLDVTGAQPVLTEVDHAGLLARSVAEVAAALAVLAPDAAAAGGRAATLVVVREAYAGLTPHVAAAVGAALTRLRHAGWQVEEASVPGFADLVTHHGTIAAHGFAAAWSTLATPPAVRSAAVAAGVRRMLAQPGSATLAAREQAAAALDRLTALTAGGAVLAMPTTPLEAVPMSGYDPATLLPRYCRNTAPFNLTGQPALSLPVPVVVGQLPVGLQLVGASGHDTRLLAVAQEVEAALR